MRKTTRFANSQRKRRNKSDLEGQEKDVSNGYMYETSWITQWMAGKVTGWTFGGK